MKDVSHCLGNPPPSEDAIIDIMMELDVNGDGKISWDEFRGWYSRVHANFKKGTKEEATFEGKALFRAYDRNHSGSLDAREFATFLHDLYQSLGRPLPTTAEVQETMKAVDTNGSGKIEAQEFHKWWVAEFSKGQKAAK